MCLKYMIPLIVYASLTTVATFVLGLWVYRLRKRTNYVECSDASDDSVKNCTERVSNICYEIEDIMAEKTKLCRAHSTPLKPSRPNVESIYDPITSTSVSQKKTNESFSKKNIDTYSHEDDDMGTVFGRQYETILQEVANTLTDIHKYNSTMQDFDIYNSFMKQLIRKMKDKDAKLYDSLQRYGVFSKHHYEVIGEKVRPQSTGIDLDSDDTYAKYLGPSKKQRPNMSEGISEKSSSFGSADHLKFLKEETNNVRISASTPYLSPKSFRPKSNCPENLKSLCEQDIKQKNIDGMFRKLDLPINKNEKDQVEVPPENHVARAYLTLTPTDEESSTPSLKEQNLETFSVKNLKKGKTPPPVPPKKSRSRTISSEDENLL
jgi:hypothetical protein